LKPLELAVQYSDKMHGCKTVEALNAIAQKIKPDIKLLGAYADWLRCEYMSVLDKLNIPEKAIEDILNKSGLKALEKGLI